MKGRPLIAAALGALALAGCGPASGVESVSAPYTPGMLRSNVARAVLALSDTYGYAIDYDSVGCTAPRHARLITCDATTTDEPTTDLHAVFDPGASGPACRGTLTIQVVGGAVLTKRPQDLCR